MKIANVPKKMSVVFGVNGQRQDLLADTVSGEPNASYNAGFPPITMIAKSAGGQAPLGKDFNQIFNELSADAQWNQASGIYPYDSEFSSAIGGYPKGSVILSTDGSKLYKCIVDDNENEVGGDGWEIINTFSSVASLEEFGGDKSLSDNGPALQAFFDSASSGGKSVLLLNACSYKITTPTSCKAPVTIIGYGIPSTFNSSYPTDLWNALSSQTNASVLMDARTSDSDTPLITFSDSTYSVASVQLRNFGVVGSRELGSSPGAFTPGIAFDHISWLSIYENISITGFGCEGIQGGHADSIFTNVQVLRCGGLVSSVARYAVDMTKLSKNSNYNRFYNLHIEHCRYMLKTSGFHNQYIGCHFELNNASFTPTSDVNPPIYITTLTGALDFDRCQFISPYQQRYLEGFTDTTNLSSNFSSVPYFIQADSSVIGNSYALIVVRFTNCYGQVGDSNQSAVKWINIPSVQTNILNCKFARCAQYDNSFKLGGSSIIADSHFSIFPITSDSTSYSSYMVGVIKPLIYGYDNLYANNVTILNGGSSSIAAFSLASTSNPHAFTNCNVGGYGYVFSTYTGSYQSQAINGISAYLQSLTTTSSATVGGNITVGGGSNIFNASGCHFEIGSTTTAGNPYFDFHSSGNNIDYDVRILASGGTTSAGGGTLSMTGASMKLSFPSGIEAQGSFYPSTSSTYSIGGSNRTLLNGYFDAITIAGGLGTSLITTAPSSSTSNGAKGQIAVDSTYIYLCTATNTWVRAPITSW